MSPGHRCLRIFGVTLGALSLAGCGDSARPPRAPTSSGAGGAATDAVVTLPESEPATDPPALAASGAAGPAPSLEFDVVPVTPARGDQQGTERVHELHATPRLAKRWTARVGKTTFRTTMALAGDVVVIGTHGASLGGKNERSDGVYVLDAKTGKQRRLIRAPGGGDLDVGGVALDGDRVFFGTDSGLVLAATLGGKLLWKAKAKGKVRAAPALADLDGDGVVDAVVGDESGALRAFSGASGAQLWLVATGENDYGARGFIGAAALADLDGDGRADVIAGARDGVLTAYRGTDGDVLWQLRDDSGIHASPVLADFDQDGAPEVLAAWSYGNLTIADARTGARRWNSSVEQDSGGIEGLFATPTPLAGAPGVLIVPTAWWGKEDGVVGVGVDQRRFKSFEGRVSASAVVTDLDDDGEREAILGTEAGVLIALHADGGRAVLTKLDGAIEASALIADVDADGSYELLVASNDGLLTCFATGSRTTPDIPRFRGPSARNTGELGAVKLGWRSQAAVRARAAGEATNAPERKPAVRFDYLTCCSALQDAATVAGSPLNALLLRGASVCAARAAEGRPRAEALAELSTLLGEVNLPSACQ